MLQRNFSEILDKWKKQPKKNALLIDGARQIGKTTLIREFGKKNYEVFVEINFIDNVSAKNIFEGDLSADEIIERLSIFTKKQLIAKHTLIFFDEVQECPAIRTSIKFLVEDGRFDYIESGSLLGINYNETKSFAVGYEDIYTMYPMTFEEFAIASGIQKNTFDILRNSYEKNLPVDEFIHSQMLKLFNYYIIVGGMPACVQEYVNSKDMSKIFDIQSNILKLYRKDILKYSTSGKEKITKIFDMIPSELNNKNKRFMLSDLTKSARSERYGSCFNWLTDAGIGLPCYNIKDLKFPLEINKQHNLFKYFFCDTGLLCAMCDSDIQYQIITNNHSVNEGSIMENIFAEQLLSNGFKLYYFDKQKYGEVDFIIEQLNEIIPVEIKSGNDYKNHKSLNNILNNRDANIKNSIVFCKGNIEKDGKITYMPFYMIMFFQKQYNFDKIKFDI